MTKELTRTNVSEAKRVRELVDKLNQYRHEYYNLNVPRVSDSVYDHLYDELVSLEKVTGIVLSSSPTQTVGYKVVSKLDKVTHPIPLLSLDKTKQSRDLLSFLNVHDALLMLKLDGLTVKLSYENGRLAEAATRGDGDVGEIITHNLPAFQNVPLTIPYTGKLVVTGEAFIYRKDFERLKDSLMDSNGKPYRNARNLAAGSARCLDANTCHERAVTFLPFSVLEGLDEFPDITDSKNGKLQTLSGYGFKICPAAPVHPSISLEELEDMMAILTESADLQDIPIDGLVITYDSISYSKTCGRTGHHYIPMIGRTASRELDRYFHSDLHAFESAVLDGFDFTALSDFGDIMNRNIHDWFRNPGNPELFRSLQKEMKFEERKEEMAMTENKNNPFEGRTIVATGKLEHFTRDSINSKIVSLGAIAGSSVTKKTDYLICGEKAGSKLAKAKELGVAVLTEQQFLDMLSA